MNIYIYITVHRSDAFDKYGMRDKKDNQTNRQTDNYVQDVKIKTYILYLNKNIVQILFYLYTKNQKCYTYD